MIKILLVKYIINNKKCGGRKSCGRLSCIQIEGGVMIVLLHRKILQGKSRNEREGEEGRTSGYKLNIIDKII